MTATLATRVCSGRAGDDCLVIGQGGRLDVARARALGPAPDLDPAATVLVSVTEETALLETLLALDGQVAGLLMVSASTAPEILAELAAAAGASVVVSDRPDLPEARRPAGILGPARAPVTETAWMMTTSGTTGLPKIVPHDLAGLTRTVRRDPFGNRPVWGLLYEMTRFAGLQVALQSLAGGGTLAAAPRHAPMQDQVDWLAAQKVSHLSATPTLWRRLMMVPGVERLALKQVTMGGEIADQAVLDAVGARFPKARVTHIYASTETGVGFAVNDRRAGFPLSFTEDGTDVRIRDGRLWLRPPDGRVVRYLGGRTLDVDSDGYVDTGDRVEVSEDRAFFLGRDSGVVNVGGVKVHPERVERTIAAVPGVGLAAVSAKKNPITGALLIATVVPVDPGADRDDLKDRIMAACRGGLEREAVPARILFADSLETNAAGKIARIP